VGLNYQKDMSRGTTREKNGKGQRQKNSIRGVKGGQLPTNEPGEILGVSDEKAEGSGEHGPKVNFRKSHRLGRVGGGAEQAPKVGMTKNIVGAQKNTVPAHSRARCQKEQGTSQKKKKK